MQIAAGFVHFGAGNPNLTKTCATVLSHRSRKDAQSPHLVAHLLLDYTAQPLARCAKDALIIPAHQLSNAASSPFRIFTSP